MFYIRDQRQHPARGRLFLPPLLLVFVLLALLGLYAWSAQPVLRIRDWESDEILMEVRVRSGDSLGFRWIHSLEHFPWQEYYTNSEELTLILDAISFPSFGAGVPENRGQSVRIEDGLIYMYDIYDEFPQLLWLNSHAFTDVISLNGDEITRGHELPERRLILRIERMAFHA
jgi:hypothetical protein